MKRVVIAVVDAAQARLFVYEDEADASFPLREVRDLRSSGRKLRVGETMSNSEPGRAAFADGSGRGYARSETDDHRDAKVAELDSRFARKVVTQLDEIIRADGHHSLIIAASPKMLGELRRQNG